jgi:hypothetical protein
MVASKGCQYCGGELAHPNHKNCQWCNIIIGEANCNGVYEVVIQAAQSVMGRVDLDTAARRAEIQAVYDQAMKKA